MSFLNAGQLRGITPGRIPCRCFPSCRQPDGSYIIDGQTLLEDIEDAFDMHFDCEDIDTINGYLIYKMGKIPQDNEQFECTCDGYSFRVLEVHDRMVTKVGARREEERQQPVT